MENQKSTEQELLSEANEIMRLKTVPKYPPWNEIKIIYHTQDKLDAMVEIESDEYGIRYCSPWESHHGMQCNFVGDTPEYNQLFEQVSIIERAVREINKICTKDGNV